MVSLGPDEDLTARCDVRVDFGRVEDVQDFASIPAGTYAVRIAEVREGVTKDGSPRWSFRLEVLEGTYVGRTAAWDSISWSERGLRRAKHVLGKLGFDVSGEIEVHGAQLVGLEAVAEITMEEWYDEANGQRQIRPRVPYHGYESIAARSAG